MIAGLRAAAARVVHIVTCAAERPTVALALLTAGIVTVLTAGWTVALSDWHRWRYDPPSEIVQVTRAEVIGDVRVGGTLTYELEATRLEQACVSLVVQPRLVAADGREVWHLPSYLGRSPSTGPLRTTVAVPDRVRPGLYGVEVDVLYQCAWGQLVRVTRVAVIPTTILAAADE